MVEIIKKSDLMAEDSFDYIKLAANMEGFVPCTVKEQSEELEISYDLTGLNNLSKMKGESEAQKMGGEAAFIDAEHALDPVYAKKLGVDIDNLIVSQPDTGEQALEITEALVRRLP